MRKLAFIHLILILASGVAYSAGEVNETGKTGLSFLRIPPSARAAALGGASTALAYGSESLWANPALIALLSSRAAQVTHTEWFDDTNIESASISTPLLGGGFGGGFILYNSGEMSLYGDEPTDSPIGTFSMHNLALNLGYSRRVLENLAVGASYKIIYEDYFTDTAGGFAVDTGIYYTSPLQGLSFGASLRNLGKMGKLRRERTTLPTDFVLGTKYSGYYEPKNISYNILLDINNPRYGPSEIRTGLEISPFDRFYIRTGWRSGSDIEKMSFGIGFLAEGFIADVSYTHMEGYEDAIRLTLGIKEF